MDIKIIYEDESVLVVDKPAGIVVFPENESLKSGEKTLIDYLIEKYPELKNAGEYPRYGVVHRLDKDTSGILLVAKSHDGLIFLQQQFSDQTLEKTLEKSYTALVTGNIKNNTETMHTLVTRSKADPRKQKVYEISDSESPVSAREAITEWKVIERYKNYTLLEVKILTGRRHQIRCHLSFISHPVAGDKLYGFKDSPCPKELKRQFLHAGYLKIQLPDGKNEEFVSELPPELKNVLNTLEKKQ